MIPLGVLASARPAAAELSLTYQETVSGTDYETVSIGPASSGRWVILAITGESFQAAASPTVTIGSTAATVDVDNFEYHSFNRLPRVTIARAPVPTGTTANIYWDGGGVALSSSATHVWTTNRAPVLAGSSTARNQSTSLSVPSAAVALAAFNAGALYDPTTWPAGFTVHFSESDYNGSTHSAASSTTTFAATINGGQIARRAAAMVSYS